MSPLQAQDITHLPSLIPVKLSDYKVLLLVRAALRNHDAGLTNRIEFTRDVRAAVERAR